MKKRLCLILTIAMSVSLSSIALANQTATGNSLTDVINGTTNQTQQQVVTQQQPVQTQTQPIVTQQQPIQTQVQGTGTTMQDIQGTVQEMRGEPNDFFGTLSGLTDMSDYEDPTVKKAGAALSNWAGMFCQFIGYVVCAGIVVRSLIDLAYIVLPFSRGILGGTGGSKPQQSHPQMNTMSSFGGGYNSFGTSTTMMTGGGANSGGASSNGGFDLVSIAAKNAVMKEGQQDQSGKVVSPFKVYIKDMAAVLILTPILFVLAVSGALTSIGFMVGEIISNMIGNITL